MRALRVCPTRGCTNLIGRGEKLCPTCLKAKHKAYNATRPSARQQGYNSEWEKIRKAYLAEHPFCAHCGKIASHVDHILPLSQGGSNESNLQSLCHKCHSKKTAGFDGGYGNKRKVYRKGA